MNNPQIVMKSLDEIRPYEKNPRRNDDAVKYLAKSIKEFGFNQPIVIDKDGVIVAGHTRYKAAEQLGLEEVPCILVSDLTDKQVKAYRLADNKIAEMSAWDFPMLNIELDELADDFDMSDFGFEEDETDVLESLLGSNYVDLKSDSDMFSITFTFPKEYESDIKEYIAENGKDGIVEAIYKISRGGR